MRRGVESYEGAPDQRPIPTSRLGGGDLWFDVLQLAVVAAGMDSSDVANFLHVLLAVGCGIWCLVLNVGILSLGCVVAFVYSVGGARLSCRACCKRYAFENI